MLRLHKSWYIRNPGTNVWQTKLEFFTIAGPARAPVLQLQSAGQTVHSVRAGTEVSLECGGSTGNPDPLYSIHVNGKEVVPPQLNNISHHMTAEEEHSGALVECFVINDAMEAPKVSTLTMEVLCKYTIFACHRLLHFKVGMSYKKLTFCWHVWNFRPHNPILTCF